MLATGPKANDGLYFALKGRSRTSTGSATASPRGSSTTRSTRATLAGRELWDPEERYIYEGDLERMEPVR